MTGTVVAWFCCWMRAWLLRPGPLSVLSLPGVSCQLLFFHVFFVDDSHPEMLNSFISEGFLATTTLFFHCLLFVGFVSGVPSVEVLSRILFSPEATCSLPVVEENLESPSKGFEGWPAIFGGDRATSVVAVVAPACASSLAFLRLFPPHHLCVYGGDVTDKKPSL